jgi:glutamyl-tRNA synthetase
MEKKIRTRIAPSPTGYVHIGTLRTALYNYYFAKHHGGDFILRVEDTDRTRYVEGSIENLLHVFERLNIPFDEGMALDGEGLISKGEFGPYLQSERLEIYKEHADKLLAEGKAYKCFCSKDRLDELRENQRAAKQTPGYDKHCLNLSESELAAKKDENTDYVVRMNVEQGKEVTFSDIVRGKITINTNEVDDQVIVKSDRYPTYHFAVVIDDHLMKISHVIRGEEWLPSTPKHVILHEMLDFELPEYAHIPLLLNEDKTKLSKRQGDVAVGDYLEKGYLPKALINFVSLLGYNPKGDQELYSEEEFIELFDLSKVNKGGAVLNKSKLDWMNSQYLKSCDTEHVVSEIEKLLKRSVTDHEKKIVAVEKGRATTLLDIAAAFDAFIEDDYEAESIVWRKADAADALMHLKALKDIVSDLDTSSVNIIESAIKKYIEDGQYQNGNVLWPLRVALSGKERSAGPFDLIWVLGKELSVERIEFAINKLQ